MKIDFFIVIFHNITGLHFNLDILLTTSNFATICQLILIHLQLHVY